MMMHPNGYPMNINQFLPQQTSQSTNLTNPNQNPMAGFNLGQFMGMNPMMGMSNPNMMGMFVNPNLGAKREQGK